MATILKRLNLEVELVTVNFGVYRSWVPALESAKALGFPHSILRLDRSILDEAVEMIIDDGFPNNGINFVHRQALEATAGNMI